MAQHKTLAFFIPHRGCPHRCSFCDQRTISGTVQAPTPEEVTQTCQAMLERSGSLESAEIAFFGGSFTAVEPAYQIALLEAAQPFLGEGMFSGIRISTRPDAVDSAVLERLERYHVTAVELGAQSMCDRVLYQNERGHDVQAVRQASAMLRERGFSLGLQQMVGLYGSTLQDEYDTLEQLLACQPETLRIYPTAVLDGTKLAEYYFRGGYPQLSQEEVLDYCADALCRCHHAGVRVIRLGLHAGMEMQRGCVAGPWHPAFRELCEGRLYRMAAQPLLERLPKGEPVTFLVHPAAVSKAVGHKRENLLWWEQQGCRVRVRGRDGVPLWQIETEEQTKDVNR